MLVDRGEHAVDRGEVGAVLGLRPVHQPSNVGGAVSSRLPESGGQRDRGGAKAGPDIRAGLQPELAFQGFLGRNGGSRARKVVGEPAC